MRAELAPFVTRTWFSAGDRDRDGDVNTTVEHVLPTGAMHLVLRFAPSPLRLLARGGSWENVGFALIGGARSVYYARVIEGPSWSVGAMLRPGAARALFGVNAGELAERHTPLAELWGSAAELLRDEIAHAQDPLAAFEAALAARLRGAGASGVGLTETLAIAGAPHLLDPTLPVAERARRSGYSHRVFTEKFREEVGLAPKAFARVARLQRAVALLATSAGTSAAAHHAKAASARVARATAAPRALADVAFEAGYTDQSHLCRDFAELAGLSPAAYRRSAPVAANHVPMGSARKREEAHEVDFVQDARR